MGMKRWQREREKGWAEGEEDVGANDFPRIQGRVFCRTPKKRPELPITGNDNNPDLRLSCQYSRHRRRSGPFTLRRSFPYLWRDSANDYDELYSDQLNVSRPIPLCGRWLVCNFLAGRVNVRSVRDVWNFEYVFQVSAEETQFGFAGAGYFRYYENHVFNQLESLFGKG